MKKILFISILAGVSATASAHELWVAAPDTAPANQIFHADLAYGDRYPHGTSIPEKRVKFFKPLDLVDSNKLITPLTLVEDNYRYATINKLKSGTYHLLATYKPTFWLKDTNGKWQQDKTLRDVPDASHCEQTQMFGKRLLVVGNEYDEITATVPVGQPLEIVPLANPHTVKAGGVLPIQVWYQGKPLAGVTITGTSDTYLKYDPDSVNEHREIQAYSAKTDKNGRANFIPLIEGEWKLHLVHQPKFDDPSVCQIHSLHATYILPVGTERAKPTAHSHDHHDHSHHDHKH